MGWRRPVARPRRDRWPLAATALLLWPLATPAWGQHSSLFSPTLVEDPQGTLHHASVEAGHLLYRRSPDGGRTWRSETLAPPVIFPRPFHPLIAVDETGHAYIFYNLYSLIDGIDDWWGGALACVTNVSGRWVNEPIEPGWRHRREKHPKHGAYLSFMRPAAAAVDRDGTLHLVATVGGWYPYGGGLYAYARTPGPRGGWGRRWDAGDWTLKDWQARTVPFGGELLVDLRLARTAVNENLARVTTAHLLPDRSGMLICYYADQISADATTHRIFRIRKAPGRGWGRPELVREVPVLHYLSAYLDPAGATHLAYTTARQEIWYLREGGEPERVGRRERAATPALGAATDGRLTLLVEASGIDGKWDIYWTERREDRWRPLRNLTSDARSSRYPLVVTAAGPGRRPTRPRFLINLDLTTLTPLEALHAPFHPVDPVVGPQEPISAPLLVDLNRDGALDLVTTAWLAQYQNDGTGTFRHLEQRFPLPGRTAFLASGDLDQDGWIDLFTRNRVVRNLGRFQFRDFSPDPPLRRADLWLEDAVLADLDGDGHLDGYLVHREGNFPNFTYRNRGAGRFEDVTETAGLDCAPDVSLCAVFGDMDGDGDADAFVGTMGPDRLLRNDGTGRFTDVTAAGGVAGGPLERTSAAAWGDLDTDGDLDLVTAGALDPLRVYRNDGAARFTPVAPVEQSTRPDRPLSESVWASLALLDMDHDGDLDCFRTDQFGPPRLYRNDGAGRLTEVTGAPGLRGPGEGSRRTAVGDMDGDGDLDVVIGHAGGVQFYRNNQDDARFLKVRLIGGRGHRDGVGARAWLYQSEYLGQPRFLVGYREVTAERPVVHFGTGQKSRFDLRVEFPGGRREERRGLARGQTVTVREGAWPVAAAWRLAKTARRKGAQADWPVEGSKLALLGLLGWGMGWIGRKWRAERLLKGPRGSTALVLGYLALLLTLPERTFFVQHALPFLILAPAGALGLYLDRKLTRYYQDRYLGRFRLLEVIGKGGMSTVWKARDRARRRPVALKLMDPALWEHPENRERIQREAALSAELAHANIVRIHEGGELAGQGYLSMELVEGRTLRELLEGGRAFAIGEVLDTARALGEALAAVHDRGIIHRDVKTSNVMRTPEGAIKLMDFGLARTPLFSTITTTGMTLGTVAYMSPEQASGKALDHRTDLYSLGVVLYELLIGRVPFSGEHDVAVIHAIMNRAPIPPREIRPEVPAPLSRLILDLMAKDRDERPQNARACLEALARVSPPPAAAPASPPAAAPPPPDFDLQRFLAINREINATSDLQKLLGLILDTAIDLIQAERGFLLLREESALAVKAARHFEREALKRPAFELSRSIAADVIDGGEPLVIRDAQRDRQVSPYASVQALKLRSVLCYPLRAEGRVIGALYFDNRLTPGAFRDTDQALLAAFADQAGFVIQRARLLQESQALNRQLRRHEQELEQRVEDQQMELAEAREALARRQSEMELRFRYDQIIGKSPAMQAVYKLLDRVADADLPVLILGETGTGKELLARTVHFNSARKGGEFVSINCAAMPEALLESELFGHVKGAFTDAVQDKPGLFEVANGGTLFLDEIADMPARMQGVLLRVLQEKELRRVGDKRMIPVDVRLLSASRQDLEALVAQGRFREDLFFRLQGVTLTLPPLRERVEDIPLLLAHFLEVIADETGEGPRTLSRKAERALCTYAWPGNVRELEHELRRATALAGSTIDAPDLSEKLRQPASSATPLPTEGSTLQEALDATERRAIQAALEACQGNKTAAARRLGIPVRTLYNRLKRLGLGD